MFKDIKDFVISILTSRLFVLSIAFVFMFSILIYQIFTLQIVHGEEYLNNFTLRIKKERSITSTRGNIYDRKGKLMAYNELVYSVTIEDTYESSDTKNEELNHTIYQLIHFIEENGDNINQDFQITLNSYGEFEYTVEGNALLRFLADVYGHKSIDDEKFVFAERTATPKEVIEYLAGKKKFAIGAYEGEGKKQEFVVGSGYTNEELLKILTVRYAMSANGFQKYVVTTVASDVKEETVAVILENKDILQGVDIAEDSVRRYVDSYYFAHIIGYTGKISQDELELYKKKDSSYKLTDMVGKAGIEQEMETQLQGKKGSETVFVDNLGKVIEVAESTDPVAGNDLYLTIDMDLQKAAYDIIEQKLAGILYTHILNAKEYNQGSSSDIKIPIDDVYFALINNNIIKIQNFEKEGTGETEKAVQQKFLDKKQSVWATLYQQLTTEAPAPYSALNEEMKVYESFIASMLGNGNSSAGISGLNVLLESEINKADEIYMAWKQETISLKEYLEHAVSQNWIDISKLDIDKKYSDSDEIYAELLNFIEDRLNASLPFSKRIYKYMIAGNQLTGREVCLLLYEQNILTDENNERAVLQSGAISAFEFIMDKIKHLKITPAQLALDPCSASCVIADPNTGEVLAMVSYPGYDNNRLANTVDAEYYNELLNDLSLPFYNNATQQKTAPGSTFKPITIIAGLEEGTIVPETVFQCTGRFEFDPPVKCWIFPSAHGRLNAMGSIQHSCNFYLNQVAYNLSLDPASGKYNDELGLRKLEKYAKMFGLDKPSGVEITESIPQISNADAVRSSIGQGRHNYTTSQLVRYVSTVANRGTCYNLSLLDKVMTSDKELVEDFTPDVLLRNDSIKDSTWNTVHQGMKAAAEGYSALKSVNLSIAGKTGTAQQITTRPNHALFVGFAPFENPEIAMSVRITHGYGSSNAVEIASNVLNYYFNPEEKEDILNGTADTRSSQVYGE